MLKRKKEFSAPVFPLLAQTLLRVSLTRRWLFKLELQAISQTGSVFVLGPYRAPSEGLFGEHDLLKETVCAVQQKTRFRLEDRDLKKGTQKEKHIYCLFDTFWAAADGDKMTLQR